MDSQKKIFVDYIPCQVSFKKSCRLYFYAYNPETSKLKRVVIKCNTIKNRSERLKYAKTYCECINDKLRNGWNPFVDKMMTRGYVTLEYAINNFLKEKGKDSRPATNNSYMSYCGTYKTWLQDINMLNSYCFLFTETEANRYMSYISSTRTITSRTWNNYIRFFTTMFNNFIEKQYLKKNPFSNIKRKKVDEKKREIIPPDTRKKMKEYLINHNFNEYYIIMLLCYRCFIRPKEIGCLKIQNIDFKNNQIEIPSDIAKNHHNRIVGIPDEIMEYLKTLQGYPRDYYIFSTRWKPGKQLKHTRDIGKVWNKMREDLQLPAKYQFYSLKDTGITEMLEAGVPAKFVKELADHSSLDMTEKYTHKTAASEILKYNKLEF